MDGCQEGDSGHGESSRRTRKDVMSDEIESVTTQPAFGAVPRFKPYEDIKRRS